MIKIEQAVIVEGRYDKIKLSNILDTIIIETNGFGIYKDKEKQNLIKKLAEERGIIVLTDSDTSGFQIRRYISDIINNGEVKHIYIPDVYGKEKRKKSLSAQGKIGVEGIDSKTLISLFEKAGVEIQSESGRRPITAADLFEDGFSGGEGSRERKKALLRFLDLPELLSTKALLKILNSQFTYEEYRQTVKKLGANRND